MTTENTTEVVNDTPEQKQEQPQEREYSGIEVKAIEQGWIPKEEFDGDESEFIDAPEFVRRGELFKKIETQSRELKNVRQALEALAKHNTKIEKLQYEKALKSLKDARKQAMMEGETERALALEDKIEEVENEREIVARDVPQIPEDDSYTPSFQAWVERNNWYETNRTMRAAADALGKDFYNQGYQPQEVLEKVEAEIRKEFAHKFASPAAKRSMAVEPSSRSGGSKRESFELSQDEREAMRQIVKTGVMTEAEYIKQIKQTRS